MSEQKSPAPLEKTRTIITVTVLVLVSLHIVTWIIASLYPDNRVLTDLYGRLGMDSELSLPTWFTSVLWFCFAVLTWLVARQQKSKLSRVAWLLLAVIGLSASIDEVVAVHELLLQGLHILANFGEGQTLLMNSWLLILPLLLLLSFFAIKTLKKGLPKDTQKQLLMAFTFFLLGAFIVEYISIPFDKSLAIYTIGVVVIEESLEIIGVMLALHAVVFHIANHEPRVRQKLNGILS